jgi:hypothetical protein
VDLETAKIDFTLAENPGAALPDAGAKRGNTSSAPKGARPGRPAGRR